jgi:nicotinamidase-related amidase
MPSRTSRVFARTLVAAVAVVGATAVAVAPLPDRATAFQDLPTIPSPVPVTLDHSTTALLVMDFNNVICTPRPACVASLPTVSALLASARRANVFVVYTNTLQPGATMLPEVVPQPSDPLVASSANKFWNTDLNEILTARGITTTLMTGVVANGAVLYTSFAANERGFTVAVAEDGISASTDFDLLLARYQLLTQPSFPNPENQPLRERAVTLTRSDLVTFQ